MGCPHSHAPKLTMLGVHVPPVLKARIVEIAARNGYTVSSYVRRLIARDVLVSDATGDLRR